MLQHVVLKEEDRIKDKEEETKITFRTSKALLRQLKHFAADNDTTVTNILNQASKEYLGRNQKKRNE